MKTANRASSEDAFDATEKADERPKHQRNQQKKQQKDDNRLEGTLVHLAYDRFVAIDEALYHGHVPGVGTMENIDDVAHEERYHAKQHVAQGIVEHGQRERNTPDNTQREIDKRHHADQRNGIAQPGIKPMSASR